MHKDTAPKIRWSPVNQAYIVTYTRNGKEYVCIHETKADAQAFVARLEKGEAFW